MNIFSKIETAAVVVNNSGRGQVKTFILAILSYSKHTRMKLTNAKVAELTRYYLPMAKTTAGSVADYINKLNSGLFDYISLDDAKTTLKWFEDNRQYEGMTYGNLEEIEEAPEAPEVPKSPWSAADLSYKQPTKKRAKKSK